MYTIEIATFRLRDGTDEAVFLEADAEVQEAVSALEGVMRRTTARGEDGTWLVLTLWGSPEHADRATDVPAVRRMMAFVDDASWSVERYRTID